MVQHTYQRSREIIKKAVHHCRRLISMNCGFTLIELLIVIAIISILAVSLGFSFEGWMGNYRIESQTKNLFTDLMEARARAITTNTPHQVVLNADKYRIVPLWPSPKNLDSDLSLSRIGSGVLPATITIDTRGLISINPPPPQGDFIIRNNNSSLTPDYDCLSITHGRIRMGQYNGSTCNDK